MRGGAFYCYNYYYCYYNYCNDYDYELCNDHFGDDGDDKADAGVIILWLAASIIISGDDGLLACKATLSLVW